jgi:hypothetical protein
MKQLLASLVVAALAGLVAATNAAAKGPMDASLTGPGLNEPIEFAAWGAGSALWPLIRAAGLHRAAWGGRLPSEPPAGDLGPRYRLTYSLGPHANDGRVVQEVYPYAQPQAVTYTAPGQPFYAMRTRGGWYVATSARARPLLSILIDAGLPRHPPTRSETETPPWSFVEWSALGGALLVGAIVALLMRRRPATAATR